MIPVAFGTVQVYDEIVSLGPHTFAKPYPVVADVEKDEAGGVTRARLEGQGLNDPVGRWISMPPDTEIYVKRNGGQDPE